MDEKLRCFFLPQGSVPDFDRQLMGQEGGINDMTVEEYLKRREAFKSGETVRDSSVAQQARKDYEKEISDKFAEQLSDKGLSRNEAKKQAADMAAQKMKTLNALHNPDLVAAGKDVIADFGDASINKSIGAQWKSNVNGEYEKTSRISELDKAARSIPEADRAKVKMNAKLERCK
jgi:hypothetical protein